MKDSTKPAAMAGRGGQRKIHGRLKANTSAPVLPVNIQDGFPLGLTSLISLQSKGLYKGEEDEVEP